MAAAPARARAIGATALQLFTKTPSQWREPVLDAAVADRFRAELAANRVVVAVSHDSYLINLASPDPDLRARSEASFTAELARCERLGIPWVISHPGNYMDDKGAGIARNAESYARCLAAVPGGVQVAVETTAGSGTALGASFQEIATLLERMPAAARDRVAVCADTCHLWAAGYDLVDNFDGVWREFADVIGMDRLVAMHLNDAKSARGSRVDRHELIGRGRIGAAVFRRIMTDRRFRGVIHLIETPKGDDGVTNDRKTLRRLRAWASTPRAPRRVAR